MHRCDSANSEVTCASDEEIDEWLSTKYILLRYNSYTFNRQNWGSDTLIKESDMVWISTDDSAGRINHVY